MVILFFKISLGLWVTDLNIESPRLGQKATQAHAFLAKAGRFYVKVNNLGLLVNFETIALGKILGEVFWRRLASKTRRMKILSHFRPS